jgi:hypothetical protein
MEAADSALTSLESPRELGKTQKPISQCGIGFSV